MIKRIKTIYFRAINRHENDGKNYLKQIIFKRNIVEYFDFE